MVNALLETELQAIAAFMSRFSVGGVEVCGRKWVFGLLGGDRVAAVRSSPVDRNFRHADIGTRGGHPRAGRSGSDAVEHQTRAKQQTQEQGRHGFQRGGLVIGVLGKHIADASDRNAWAGAQGARGSSISKHPSGAVVRRARLTRAGA